MSISFKRSRSSSRGPVSTRRLSRGGFTPPSAGFTLIELLTVIAIMVVVTTVLLVRQSQFDSSTVLRSLGYGVGLSLRQAQVYGTSVFGTTTASGNCKSGSYVSGVCFASAYGVHVVAGNPTSYALYADLNNNGQYDTGEDIQDFNLGTGYYVSNACVDLSGFAYCTSSCTIIPFGLPAGNCATSPTWVDVVFHRPNPDACITESGGPFCTPGSSNSYSAAYIQVSNGNGTRGVTVTSTGEITVGSAGS
jgi:prepilin-type N-terminal cleavage/methylation domain-containing protein